MMLEQLLNEIRKGGSLQPVILAERLHTSVELVEMMLEELERRGLLALVNTACNENCNGCSLAGACTIQSSGRMWVLTHHPTI